MTALPEKYTGYGALTEQDGKALNLSVIDYKPKTFTDNDIDLEVISCGICGSDVHVLTNGWPAPSSYPAIVGHEVVGIVRRAGKNSGHQVGDRVGVGAQGGSCQSCEMCEKHREQYCSKGMVGTYQGKWEDGSISQGGYANFMRCQGRFAVKIPEEISSEEASPLLCAGVTTYSPLRRFGCGPGKKVAVVGIGGLGHLALQFAKAMGAETFALSHSESKKADAAKMGIKEEHFIVAKDTRATAKTWKNSFDLILCTSFASDLPIDTLYFRLLKPEGALILCGLPEEKLPPMYGQAFVNKGLTLAGSMIGGTHELKDMFELAARTGVRPWIQIRPMSEASQAVKDMDKGLARYRYVLKN